MTEGVPRTAEMIINERREMPIERRTAFDLTDACILARDTSCCSAYRAYAIHQILTGLQHADLEKSPDIDKQVGAFLIEMIGLAELPYGILVRFYRLTIANAPQARLEIERRVSIQPDLEKYKPPNNDLLVARTQEPFHGADED